MGYFESCRAIASVTHGGDRQRSIAARNEDSVLHLKRKFLTLRETYKPQNGKDVADSDDLLVCDALCNVRGQQVLKISDRVVFVSSNMEAFCDFAKYVQKCRRHGHIFCSSAQFASCRKLFCPRQNKLEVAVGE